jgi:hypothetical protein
MELKATSGNFNYTSGGSITVSGDASSQNPTEKYQSK